ncbi:glypican-5-like isoform X3 [Aquarana catesbeiana]|uniref:glypican-5-like isoform X3 n=1 Tax=Aquarana catesbeiana TaxID=8400 RepID=UPI003CCA0F1B
MPMFLLLLLLLLNFVALMPAQGPPSCHEVRAAFQLQQVGRGRLVPEVPVEESDVQICEQKAPTCCTRKMEESYQAAVKRKMAHNIQALNFELKFTIVAHASAFQETFTYLIDLATNNTLSLFHSKYSSMAQDVQETVKELFTDLSLNIMGADMPLEDAFSRFLDALFPVVYNHLINPRIASLSDEYLDCLRLTRQDINPFGNYSNEMTTRLSKSLWTSRMIKQALNMAEQVINSTEHAGLTRECTYALVKMQYCPHCQGLTLIRPCVGYCLNVMRGCLASLASLDGPWRGFISLVDHLANQITGSNDLEQSLLGIRDVIDQSIQHAESQGSLLSKMVEKVCGELQESPVKRMPEKKTNEQDPTAVLPSGTKRYSLAQLRSYTNLVVSSDFKDQVNNPEVKVRGSNVIINQVINKMRLFIQMGSERRIKAERWRITEGSGEGGSEGEEDQSGDCDDEDGCQGSGESIETDTKRRTNNSVMVDLTMKAVPQNPSATKTAPKEKDSSNSGSRVCTSALIVVASLLIMCQIISQLCSAAATF